MATEKAKTVALNTLQLLADAGHVGAEKRLDAYYHEKEATLRNLRLFANLAYSNAIDEEQ